VGIPWNFDLPLNSSVPRVSGIPGPYRFFFYSFDCREPKHVHARRERMVCKFWLEPISLVRNHGFRPWELNVIRSYIENHLAGILEAWDEHCG
jgi:uncharacterized protein DUF4160